MFVRLEIVCYKPVHSIVNLIMNLFHVPISRHVSKTCVMDRSTTLPSFFFLSLLKQMSVMYLFLFIINYFIYFYIICILCKFATMF